MNETYWQQGANFRKNPSSALSFAEMRVLLDNKKITQSQYDAFTKGWHDEDKRLNQAMKGNRHG